MVASPESNSNSNADVVETDVVPIQTEEQKANDSDVDSFFDSLDREVNDVIYDDKAPEKATQEQSGSEQATHEQQNGSLPQEEEKADIWDTDDNPYKKRYSDSSKEAVRLQQQYKEVEPFVPVLEAMKNDSGLVDHVRDYLVNGGKPAKTIQEQLQLDEDFVFDSQEAMTDPDSDSAKVMGAHVDSIVQQRVGQILTNEKQNAEQARIAQTRQSEEAEFKKNHDMTDEAYEDMVNKAKKHTLSLEDIYFVLNRDKNAANVRNSTQKDMLNQMKNVRQMPTSNSDANNMGETQTTEEQMFDSIFGVNNTDNGLFG